jgi:hypothetical protein
MRFKSAPIPEHFSISAEFCSLASQAMRRAAAASSLHLMDREFGIWGVANGFGFSGQGQKCVGLVGVLGCSVYRVCCVWCMVLEIGVLCVGFSGLRFGTWTAPSRPFVLPRSNDILQSSEQPGLAESPPILVAAYDAVPNRAHNFFSKNLADRRLVQNLRNANEFRGRDRYLEELRAGDLQFHPISKRLMAVNAVKIWEMSSGQTWEITNQHRGSRFGVR